MISNGNNSFGQQPERMPFRRGLGYSLRLMAALFTLNGEAAENVMTEVEAFWAGERR